MEATVSKAEYEELKAENAALRHELAELKRLIFGARSEKQRDVGTGTEQLDLGFGGPATTDAETGQSQTITYQRRKKKAHPGRTELPDHLPVEEVIIEPEEDIAELELIGAEITETLDYRPGKLVKRRYIRRKYARRQATEDEPAIVIGSLPSRPIDKGIPEAGLLAHLLVSKYVDHLPFYRQGKILQRDHGLLLSKATLNDWFAATCTLLEPLYEAHLRCVVQTDYLQVDESPIKVLDSEKKGKTHQGYQWVYRNPLNGLVLFDYRKGRGTHGVMERLADFTGYLQTDGYQAYTKYLRKHPQVTGVSCLAHIRRYFYQARDHHPLIAGIALALIGRLYHVEAHCRQRGRTSGQRLALRRRVSLPIYRLLVEWVEYEQRNNLSKGAIGKALHYGKEQLPKLAPCFEDGRLELDNNLIENSIRPLALGRKNYLFAGSHKAAQRAAMMYSFFASCRKLDINPWQWLRDVLQRIPDHPVNRLRELLPDQWTPVGADT